MCGHKFLSVTNYILLLCIGSIHPLNVQNSDWSVLDKNRLPTYTQGYTVFQQPK